MEKFMGVTTYYVDEMQPELIGYDIEGDSESYGHNWLYITMVLLPQYIGDWHLDANWMVTKMTAKKFVHPIDYLYEKYIEK